MARLAKDRRPAIAEAALAAFIDRGYRQTQVADVARRLRIAVGTIYTQLKGKEALFTLAVRHALGLPLDGPEDAPALIKRQIGRGARWPLLAAARDRRRPRDVRAELTAVLGELYDNVAARHRLIKLLDRCAWEMPELAELYARQVRGRYIADLTAYIARRAGEGAVRAAHPAATTRGAFEAIVWMAMHRHNDRQPPPVDEATAREAIVTMVAGGLLR